jgi:hypothetical protein
MPACLRMRLFVSPAINYFSSRSSMPAPLSLTSNFSLCSFSLKSDVIVMAPRCVKTMQNCTKPMITCSIRWQSPHSCSVGSIFRFCRISTWDPLAKPVAMSVTYVRWSKVLKRLNLVIRLPDSNVKASSTSLTSTSWLLTLVFIILILLKTL